MFAFYVILILITSTDELTTVHHRSIEYPTYALCRSAREAFLKDLAQRDDINGLYAEPCSMKL